MNFSKILTRFFLFFGSMALVIGLSYFFTRDGGKGEFKQVPSAAPERKSPEVLGLLGDFLLIDQVGRETGPNETLGSVCIVNFIFTRCTATCPVQTAKMVDLAKNFTIDPTKAGLQFLSISVDPEHDRPNVLSEYAARERANDPRWSFLTGARSEITRLCDQVFKLPVKDAAPPAPIVHSPMIALVDPLGRIRGYYDGLSNESMENLKLDATRISQERLESPDGIGESTWLRSADRSQREFAKISKVNYNFTFTDKIRESGIRFRHNLLDECGPNFHSIHYDHGNGLAVADVDGDGRLDIYFTNQAGPNELWRNLGGGRFEDITESSGTAAAGGVTSSASFADIDNDGDADLYVTKIRTGNILYLNDGKGHFQNVSLSSGIDFHGFSSSAILFDYDQDGRLDLFLVNIGKFTTDEVVKEIKLGRNHKLEEFTSYKGLKDSFVGHLDPELSERSRLYHNIDGLRFEDVSDKVGIHHESWSGDGTVIDGNDDGRPDLYILGMQGADKYYENVDGKSFIDKTEEVFPKSPWGAMGVKSFDRNNDGKFDLFVSDMHTDMWEFAPPGSEKFKTKVRLDESYLRTGGKSIYGNAFFEKINSGQYVDVCEKIAAENYWPWGMSVGDLNADGFEDVFITTGMGYPFRYSCNTLLLNEAGERFLDSEFLVGLEPRKNGRTAIPGFARTCKLDGTGDTNAECIGKDGQVVIWHAISTRSSAVFDLDDDGDLDIVTNDYGSEPMVLVSNLTETLPNLKYLKLKLFGKSSNRSALGARVKLTAGGNTMYQVLDGKSGYLSQSLIPLYFGLNGADSVEEIVIEWPVGTKQTLHGPIATNRTLEIREP